MPHPYSFHACSQCQFSRAKGSPLHPGPAAVPLSLEAVMKPYMEGPWRQRLSLEQPVLVISQSCTYSVPPPAPPDTTALCSQPFPEQP